MNADSFLTVGNEGNTLAFLVVAASWLSAKRLSFFPLSLAAGWLLHPATGEGWDGGDAYCGYTPIPTFPRDCGGRSQPAPSTGRTTPRTAPGASQHLGISLSSILAIAE